MTHWGRWGVGIDEQYEHSLRVGVVVSAPRLLLRWEFVRVEE